MLAFLLTLTVVRQARYSTCRHMRCGYKNFTAVGLLSSFVILLLRPQESSSLDTGIAICAGLGLSLSVGPIAPPVPNARSSECPRPSFDRSTTPRRRFNYNIPASVVLLQQCHCRNRHRGKLQNVSPPSVLFEWSRIFYHTQETQTQKMMDQNFENRIL